MYYNTRSVSSMLGTWLKCCYWPGPINQSGQVKQGRLCALRYAMTRKLQLKQVLGQQIPWQVSVGAAFCLTVLCCAKQRRSRSRQRRTGRTQAAAPATRQVGVRSRATDDLAEVKQEGKGSAAQCQLPLLAVPLIDETLSCSVKQLWSIICKPDPAFQATIHRLSGNKDIQYGDWQQQGGSLVREEQYINPLKKNKFGPTEALCIDRQQCIHRSASGFVVERRVYTPKVPFGGSFFNLVQWCAWSEPGSGKAHLQVSCDVVFTARWVPAKGIINSSSIEGMLRFYKMWLEQLHRHMQLHSSPSHSVATRSPLGQPQAAPKRGPEQGGMPRSHSMELECPASVGACLCMPEAIAPPCPGGAYELARHK
ncbi:hypothetical protein ABBQ38_005608 [Trebouxia sp. C0009 RCD-2024]